MILSHRIVFLFPANDEMMTPTRRGHGLGTNKSCQSAKARTHAHCGDVRTKNRQALTKFPCKTALVSFDACLRAVRFCQVDTHQIESPPRISIKGQYCYLRACLQGGGAQARRPPSPEVSDTRGTCAQTFHIISFFDHPQTNQGYHITRTSEAVFQGVFFRTCAHPGRASNVICYLVGSQMQPSRGLVCYKTSSKWIVSCSPGSGGI